MSANTFERGSTKELWQTSAPLMLSFLATFSMMFADRLFLANYSMTAHNAAVNAGTLAWTFTYGLQTLTEMAEIFVAQYNGAGQRYRLGVPVWQMMWVSLMSIPFMLIIGFFLGPWLFSADIPGYEDKVSYFSLLTCFGPLCGVLGALMAFFVGQGRMRVITAVAIIGNVVNVVLDPILIFGVDDFIEPMGVQGAAIATVIGISSQVLVLLWLFFRPVNRRELGANQWRFQGAKVWRYLKVTSPSAVMVFLEIGGWGIFYALMAEMGELHILMAGICQDFALLLFFFGMGLHKGVAAIVGNFIGSKKLYLIGGVLRRAILMCVGFSLVVTALFTLFSKSVLGLFVNQAMESGALSEVMDVKHFSDLGFYCLLLCCLYVFFEQLKMVMGAALGAAGDTKFLMLSSILSIWIFLLIPTYFLVVLREGSVELAIGIWSAYAILNFLVNWWRYTGTAWYARDLVSD